LLAVTTFHPEAGRTYAKTLIAGLSKWFPGKVIAYYEAVPDWTAPNVELRNWHGIKDADRFIERIKLVSGADGWVEGQFDFRFNCHNFCRKVFAQEAVFDEAEYVFWFDSDCVIKQSIPEDFLSALFDGKALVYMGRNTYTETGFIGFHVKHPEFPAFRAKYLPYFTTGQIFTQLKGWHDCIAFDYARQGVSGTNLTPRGRNYDPVLEQSVLAPYMDHLKGSRKVTGEPARLKWA
jgi:hypothetical protein